MSPLARRFRNRADNAKEGEGGIDSTTPESHCHTKNCRFLLSQRPLRNWNRRIVGYRDLTNSLVPRQTVGSILPPRRGQRRRFVDSGCKWTEFSESGQVEYGAGSKRTPQLLFSRNRFLRRLGREDSRHLPEIDKAAPTAGCREPAVGRERQAFGVGGTFETVN